MPNDQDDAPGTESGEGRLPAPTHAPATRALDDSMQTPALSDEEIQERQDAMGKKRKPAGPPLGNTRGPGDLAPLDVTEDVPETDVTPAREFDPEQRSENDGGGDEGPEPLESSERD